MLLNFNITVSFILILITKSNTTLDKRDPVISDFLGVQSMYHHTHAVLQILESIKNTTTIIDSALQGSNVLTFNEVCSRTE